MNLQLLRFFYSFLYIMSIAGQHIDNWHLKIPTVGLSGAQPIYYPYRPHQFSLLDLAPKKGKGITIVLVDTGLINLPAIDNTMPRCNLNVLPSVHKCIQAIKQVLKVFIPKVVLNADDLYDVIIACCIGQDDTVKEYLKKHGINDPVTLAKASDCLKHVIVDQHFTINKYHGKWIITDFLPQVQRGSSIASHGTYCHSLLKHQSTGLCPEATVIMIKACEADGTSDKAILCRALKKAQALKADIVCLGLKLKPPIADHKKHQFEQLLKQIPYVVVAAGNEALSNRLPYYVPTLSYPASLSYVAFDVGAFGYDGKANAYKVAPFSEFQKEYGPKLLAPGFAISVDGTVVHGTSFAAAQMAGYVALILAEFQSMFTKNQLLKVCYTSTIAFGNTPEWQERSLLGTLDVKTALFVLHVLQKVKSAIGNALFLRYFDHLVLMCHIIICYPLGNAVPLCKYTMDTLLAKESENPIIQHKSLAQSIDEVVAYIVPLFNNKLLHADVQLYKRLREIFYQKTVDLFAHLPTGARSRIRTALE